MWCHSVGGEWNVCLALELLFTLFVKGGNNEICPSCVFLLCVVDTHGVLKSVGIAHVFVSTV